VQSTQGNPAYPHVVSLDDTQVPSLAQHVGAELGPSQVWLLHGCVASKVPVSGNSLASRKRIGASLGFVLVFASVGVVEEESWPLTSPSRSEFAASPFVGVSASSAVGETASADPSLEDGFP
jgi:hypothetical protein